MNRTSSPAAAPASSQAPADADRAGVPSLFDSWLAVNVQWWDDHEISEPLRRAWLESAAERLRKGEQNGVPVVISNEEMAS